MNWEIFKKPLVIAHRGDTKVGVENTLPAVESAMKLGVDGIEVDLRLTRDGHVVLFHDDDLRRLAGRPERIEDLDLAEVQKIRLKNTTLLPTLEELLDLVRNRYLLNLELKIAHIWLSTLETAVVRILKDFRLDASVLISSFQPISLWKIKRLAPHLARGYLFESKWSLHRLLTPIVRPFSINAPLSRTDAAFIEAARARGRRFLVWTVNEVHDMERLIECGVDGLITDEPQKLLALIHKTNG